MTVVYEWGICLKVLVTGCAGFIGSRVSTLLAQKGYEVKGVDSLSDAYDVRLKHWRVDHLLTPNGVEWVNHDITDNESVSMLIDDFQPDAVVNLAARAGVRQSIDDPLIYYETNVTGTLNLLELCREQGIEKFVLSSTSSVYGAADNQIDPSLSEGSKTYKQLHDVVRGQRGAELQLAPVATPGRPGPSAANGPSLLHGTYTLQMLNVPSDYRVAHAQHVFELSLMAINDIVLAKGVKLFF